MTGRRCLMCEGAECHGAVCRPVVYGQPLCTMCGAPMTSLGTVCHRCAQQTPRTRIPAEALAAVERLLAASAQRMGERPGEELWAAKSVTHHVQKGVGHGMEYQVGIRSDAETGESPALHAFARFMFAVALEERGRK